MGNDFSANIAQSAKSHKSKIVLALDIGFTERDQALLFAENTVNLLKDYVCAIKINFHLILPLDIYSEVKQINDLAHSYNLQSIADIKLNDIGNTNEVALSHLWSAGFDAATISSFIGLGGLREAISYSHENKKGAISLVYMSHRSAADTYDLQIIDPKTNKTLKMYMMFLRWAEELQADGIIVGATVPNIIKECSERLKEKILIFSPGVGTQGGDPNEAIRNGSDFLVVGRSIINAKEPEREASKLQEITWNA